MPELAARIAGDASSVALLACNVLAVAIAMSYPPITMSIMFLYWAECVVIGVLNIAKMQYTPLWYEDYLGRDRQILRIAMPAIFFVHYGFFVFGGFVMLKSLAEHELAKAGVQRFDFSAYYADFIWPVLILAAGHVVSFFRNFLGKREYEKTNMQEQMWKPYRRVIGMVLIVFAGCFLVIITRMPTTAALLFVPFKLWADLRAHFRDHAASAAAPTDPRT